MKCPMKQCQSENVEATGAKVETGGKLYYGIKCLACGYYWSSDEVPVAKPTAPATADEKPKADADTAPSGQKVNPGGDGQQGKGAEGDPAAKTNTAGDDAGKNPPADVFEPVDPKDVKLGDVLKVRTDDGEKIGPLVKITRKTFLLDFDGAPDKRVSKDALIGRLVKQG